MSLTEQVELLGKGLYTDIPDTLTLKSIPTASELDYVGAEDFDNVMLTKILPQVIEENIDPKQLLEIDYSWILRALRILNYGPYIEVGAIFCDNCDEVSHGQYQVNIESVPVKTLPENFVNSITISKEEFIFFDKDIEIELPTIQKMLNSEKDNQFKDALGNYNRKFARMCYMIKSIGGETLDPVQIRLTLQNKMEPADYAILSERIQELADYGLRAGGSCVCPKCHHKEAAFITFIDEKFFRPTVACLRRWASDRSQREKEKLQGTEGGVLR